MVIQFQTLVDVSVPTTSVQSISRSGGQKVCFLGRSVDNFEVSDDDSMIPAADPRCRRRSTDFMLKKSEFGKITVTNQLGTRKIPEKQGFWARSGCPNLHGRRRPWGLCPMVGRLPVAFSSPFFVRFRFCFLLHFSWNFLSFIGWISLKKT